MSNPSIPSADQLAAARLAHWHHNTEPILTINMLRDWLNTSGLVLFTPRAQQLPVPAPSFVEVILGAANAAPTLAETEEPRSLLARLIADGAAIPLNLLGNPTGTGSETPDFIVSTLAFPYIFTLRGDKTWKQPPTTSGAAKVSPLALATYNLLAERITLSAYDLATQLGKEVTETAVLRALTELWQHLRVIPVPQPDGAATLWELTTTRFTKQIKAGANAGQPTALSALISLYLGQAIVASEDEIETFLSPVASRSRIRDVVHALMSARQLETVAVEGKTVLHVSGELPAFLAVATHAPDDVEAIAVTTEGDTGEAPRITKFIPKPRKTGTGFVAKPGRSSAADTPDRERRPFKRAEAPDFSKPWDEEKRDKPVRRPKSYYAAQAEQGTAAPDASSLEQPEAPRTYIRKPSSDREGKRPSFGSFGSKPRLGGDRPTFRRSDSGEARPPRREFTPRPPREGDSSEARPPRKTFSKPGTFGRSREGYAGKSFSRDSETTRPPRRDYGDARPPRREYTPRPDSDSRPPRRTFSDKPSFSGPRKPGSYAPRPQGASRGFEGDRSDRSSGFAPRKPYTPREGGAGPSRFGGKPSFTRDREDRGEREGRGGERGGRPSGPPFRKFDAPRGKFPSDRPARPEGSPRSSSYGDKPSGSFAAKKPYSKSGGGYAGKSSSYAGKSSGGSFAGKKPYGKPAASSGKPASTFDKFKDNKKPFGKRPPSRKYKPAEGESAE